MASDANSNENTVRLIGLFMVLCLQTLYGIRCIVCTSYVSVSGLNVVPLCRPIAALYVAREYQRLVLGHSTDDYNRHTLIT